MCNYAAIHCTEGHFCIQYFFPVNLFPPGWRWLQERRSWFGSLQVEGDSVAHSVGLSRFSQPKEAHKFFICTRLWLKSQLPPTSNSRASPVLGLHGHRETSPSEGARQQKRLGLTSAGYTKGPKGTTNWALPFPGIETTPSHWHFLPGKSLSASRISRVQPGLVVQLRETGCLATCLAHVLQEGNHMSCFR